MYLHGPTVRLRFIVRLFEDPLIQDSLNLYQDSMVPGLLSRQDAPQVALIGGCHARQDKRHANVAVRWAPAASHARRPEELLRSGPVEPWDVDADAQPGILAWMGVAPGERRSPRMALAPCSS